ncbi:Amino acid permease-associated region OS=Tsukamurella paurometabola (strain ATCC 8368 / DSM/ CCUG 35730 / CIP 100753 / JCM 10117 / KCTC 9821 / NBRC 16120/ NCIMB 702349 / NCTC 13040) OX=521096 GN=Tpau_2114 PE=4 SV=1 [Tsukamurella paurometabola]|uniref:Amino acid permease-associated region n=1 Tax=Tsukamurella paurometabola (strain ATCC 8368 / DSM 20162 / CCUG 35730 / CIP 100753 / JCM 10117 / KCTC 9821 / NBRC 16120 / NCIMB 702349 / NCTC 13040) TaxID=521096 RepID=D5UPG9_TSUPD|nr:amino acid permease [Tsukamurella paurometabola]ADG78725.1 amino acid permease-associated region [Tsukamurella paurometabola DSM 20162]SUP32901.1 Serine/threonine exchanger SteT [Tsukamurella paurometabola]
MDLLRTKPIARIKADGAAEGGLRRDLGLIDLVGFGVGIVIGTGIFTLTGIQAKVNAGPGIAVSFVVAGVVSLFAALCYAELASAVPTAGSAYTYAYATIGEVFAWIIGWDLLLEFGLGAAVVSRSWSGYLADLFGLPPSLFTEEAPVNVGAIAIILVLGLVAAFGIRESARVTNGLVLVKVGISVFVVIVGAFFVTRSNLVPFIPESVPAAAGGSALDRPLIETVLGGAPSHYGMAGILTAAAVVFFAYTGFEAVANLGEESKRPERDMPRALIGTLLACTLLYVLVSLVLTGMVKYTDIDESAPLSKAFEFVGAGWAGDLVAVAAVAGLTSVILVELVTMGRIGYAMGRDGLIPPAVARVSPKHGTPVRFTVLVVIVCALLGGFVPIEKLSEMVSIGALFAFLLVSLAVPVLRRTKPDLKRPFRVPFSPVIPILSGLACVALMTNLAIATWLRFLVWFLLGLAIYLLYGRRHSVLAREAAAEKE